MLVFDLRHQWRVPFVAYVLKHLQTAVPRNNLHHETDAVEYLRVKGIWALLNTKIPHYCAEPY
jgi:hypothetical protein